MIIGFALMCFSFSDSLSPSSHLEDLTQLDFNSSKKMIDSLIDKWHLDASETNFDNYFSFMSPDFVFLGTDPKERWTKKEFAAYCKPHFDSGRAWTFKRNWRNLYFNEAEDTAWFEESLDTQMDECRGSGVLIKVKGEWKITYYNLTVLIENEKMEKFLELRRK